MKKRNGFEAMHEEAYVFQYADGVPAAEKKQYWNQSPWDVFRLLLRQT